MRLYIYIYSACRFSGLSLWPRLQTRRTHTTSGNSSSRTSWIRSAGRCHGGLLAFYFSLASHEQNACRLLQPIQDKTTPECTIQTQYDTNQYNARATVLRATVLLYTNKSTHCISRNRNMVYEASFETQRGTFRKYVGYTGNALKREDKLRLSFVKRYAML